MISDLFFFDDPVTDVPVSDERAASMRVLSDWWVAQNPFVKGGEYRNRFGSRVTWRADADGKRMLVQTWTE